VRVKQKISQHEKTTPLHYKKEIFGAKKVGHNINLAFLLKWSSGPANIYSDLKFLRIELILICFPIKPTDLCYFFAFMMTKSITKILVLTSNVITM
jgi:hypothetical protein